MSDYINSYLYNYDPDNWSTATKNFSENSINSLFDVDDDGVFSAVERDRAENIALLNELSSINPIIARAYNDINFNITQGTYLTQKQYEAGQKFFNAIQKVLQKEDQKQIIEHDINPEPPNIYQGDLDTSNLIDVLKNRQFLTEQELTNDV